MAECIDLSTYGMCLSQVNLGLSIRQAVELRIILELPNGITKIHWRRATVVWIRDGRTGVSMDSIPQHGPPAVHNR